MIVKPGNNKVIPLEPEFITPQDGHLKQDCENAAAKRWLSDYGPWYRESDIIILGDDLYSRQPLCLKILEQGFDFVLICKPDSHKILCQWQAELDHMGEIKTKSIRRQTGKRAEIDTYRFINQVPLKDGDDALQVNWCELTTGLDDGTIIYRNSFVTNIELSDDNIIEVVTAGRARWKNENNNIRK